VNWINN